MSFLSVLNKINIKTLQYIPVVIAGVQFAETADASGEDKFHAVLDTTTGITNAVAQIEDNPKVNAVAGYINQYVAIANLLGLFTHKPAPAK